MQGPAVTHLSVRVPWQDTRWDGRVCADPSNNQSCVVLKAIAENRNDAKEDGLRGQWMADLPLENKPACFKERATFLSDREITLQVRLDYAEWSDAHKHIQRTPVRVPAYGATLVPFRWLLRENAYDIAKDLGLEVSEDREPTEPKFLARTDWVQNHDNQQVLLDAFAERCVEKESLVFFYAKRTPLADDDRRVIVAVGLLSHKGKVEQYDYARQAPTGHLRAMMWERPIQHSIRPDKNNPGHFIGGIVLPYHPILERAADDPSIDTASFLACAPDEVRGQFSYASEHVSHGAAITSLIACKAAIERASKLLTGPWPEQIAWIDEQINRLWKLSGPCPGLGSALSALQDGFNGTLFALALSAKLAESDDPWEITDKIFRKKLAAPSGAPKITAMLGKRWEHLHKAEPRRAALLRLLSRFELTRDQAIRWFEKKHLTEAVLGNPYLLYEGDRTEVDPIGLWTVDRGLFSDHEVFKRHPLPKECTIDTEEPDDPRRLRAAGIMILERAASVGGHSLLGASEIHEVAKELPATRPIALDGTAIEICKDDFSNEIMVTSVPSLGGLAGQLKRYADYGEVIRRTVGDRLTGKITPIKVDWRAKLDTAFGPVLKGDKEEEKARKEKASALDVMASTRLSVLIGAAGTGKTTVLRQLLEQKKIVGSGVALLAPTGKARVRLGQQTGLPERTQTLAQFLMQYRRYDGNTGRYFASAEAPQADGVTTCIVDEVSMLTEDQLAALVDALAVSAKLIFVGDPRQLPPIGAGRPFVDLISYLEREHGGRGIAELTVRRRHASVKTAAARLRDLACADVQLADLFSGRNLPPGEDEILDRVLAGKFDKRLRAVAWKSPADLRNVLDGVLEEELGLIGENKEKAMSLALGGTEQNGHIYYNAGPQIKKTEAWQILTPHRNLSSGSIDINRHIKARFRRETLQFARTSNEGPPRWHFRTVEPRGPEQITYGDKVICVRNHRHQSYAIATGDKDSGYVANGEIGIVVGQAMSSNSRLPYTNVQFASQPEFTYGFSRGYFSEERSPVLELAYAVTVHKAQGSEFGKVVLVLPERSRLLSREMLYTALTRQVDRVIILHQGSLAHLRAYRSPYFSEVARRVTNLFAAPSMIEASPPPGLTTGPIGRTFLEEKLIHRSARGDLVSSKSELVIADLLFEAEKKHGIRYFFERAVVGADGETRWPDFSIEDRNGETWYWEHCGLLDQEDYADRWKKKLAFYARNGVKRWSKACPEGRLIVTEDGPTKGLDSGAIRELIGEVCRK